MKAIKKISLTALIVVGAIPFIMVQLKFSQEPSNVAKLICFLVAFWFYCHIDVDDESPVSDNIIEDAPSLKNPIRKLVLSLPLGILVCASYIWQF